MAIGFTEMILIVVAAVMIIVPLGIVLFIVTGGKKKKDAGNTETPGNDRNADGLSKE
ncbi:hypothetical protein ACFSPU_10210 [Haoranjiania flava]|uniref:Uncharacterized protein n=1 Tax=Haoranjiania flava TaxID=1856322 RepID=A0AAE3INY5_9BACT|nr:hypothetical protein [Haoranjiania flava]MCU7695418.1 hypothetical protein [Haoranjiania flava]